LFWRADAIAAPLASVRDRQSRLIRYMAALGFDLQRKAVLQTLTADVLRSSEIEGEKLDARQDAESTMDITAWLEWFLGCLGRAIDGAQETLGSVLAKARFWERINDVQINVRQRLVLDRLIDGFEGKLTTSSYATLAKCSQDTAHRDILALIEHRVLVQNPEGGWSTSYSLAA